MMIRTEEFMAIKIAVGVLEEKDLTKREARCLASALEAIADADARLAESNRRQAKYMKTRRLNERMNKNAS